MLKDHVIVCCQIEITAKKDAQTVLEKVIAEKPSLSLRKTSQVAKISHSLVILILKNGLKPYKMPDFA